MTTSSWPACRPLRMRVRKSATGSVIDIALDLPARLRDARDEALVRDVAQADPAEAELAVVRARATAALAAVVVARRVLARARLLYTLGSLCHLVLVLLGRRARAIKAVDGVRIGCGRRLVRGSRDRIRRGRIRSPIEVSGVLVLVRGARRRRVSVGGFLFQLLARCPLGLRLRGALLVGDGRRGCSSLGAAGLAVDEREPEGVEQGIALVVGLGRGGEDDVQPAHLVDGVVVDLRADDLLPDAERVVAAAVELGRQTAEVADPRDRDCDQAIQELVHACATERDGDADRVALAQLELRDRLARAAHVRVLAGDRRQLLGRTLEDPRLTLGVADAHVHGDLVDLRRLHRARVAETLDQRGLDLVLVLLLQARMNLGLCNSHQSMSFPLRLATRPRRPSSSRRSAMRVGWFELGSTSITFEM